MLVMYMFVQPFTVYAVLMYVQPACSVLCERKQCPSLAHTPTHTKVCCRTGSESLAAILWQQCRFVSACDMRKRKLAWYTVQLLQYDEYDANISVLTDGVCHPACAAHSTEGSFATACQQSRHAGYYRFVALVRPA
jgi:hypothetical protein